MKKKISWESQHIELAENNKEKKSDDEYSDGYDDAQEINLDTLISTPWGMFRTNDTLNPYRQFEFWMGHTNFVITHEAKNILNRTPGVEVLFIVSPYRFIVAKAKMFEWRDVRVAIERALCGKHNVQTQLDSIPDKKVAEEISKLRADLAEKYEYWAIYILPNGKYDYFYTDESGNVEDYINQVSLYDEAKQMSGGIVLSSMDINE